MEDYDEEYIKRIEVKAKSFIQFNKWNLYEGIDLSHFSGIVIETKDPAVILYNNNSYSSICWTIRDKEMTNVYVYLYDEKNIVYVYRTSTETFDYIVEEWDRILKWKERVALKKKLEEEALAEERKKAEEAEESKRGKKRGFFRKFWKV